MRLKHPKTWIVLGIYLPYLMFFALAPFAFHRDDALSFPELINLRFEGWSSLWRLTAWDIWTNVLFFLPCGLLLVWLPSVASMSPTRQLCVVAALAAFLSLGIEMAQMFLPRQPSIADVGCNILGAILGGSVGIGIRPAWEALYRGVPAHLMNKHSCGLVMSLYWAALFLLFCGPLPLVPDFTNWDRTLRIRLGNETTLSRPWRGEFFGVALYERALSPDELRTNLSAGPPGVTQTPPITGGLVARYDFAEGAGTTVHDRVGSPHPVDLRIEDPLLVRWLRPKGLAVLGSTSMASVLDSAGPLHERLSANGEMSVEVWLISTDVKQPGPNPFLSSSNRIDLRNFTLAQDAGNLVFWLRTPLTGLNGRKEELRTLQAPLTGELQHLVVTYASGVAATYVDGVEQARLVLDRKPGLLDAIVDGIGPDYVMGVRSAFIFPFGVLSYLSSGRGRDIWKAFVAALAGVGILEAGRVLILHAPAGGSVMAVSVGTVLVATLAASALVSPYAPFVSRPKS